MSLKIEPYVPHDPFVWCDICGFRFHASETKMQWDKKRTCIPCFDEKPQFMLPIPTFPREGQPIRNARPKPAPVTRSQTGPLDYNGLDSGKH